MAYLMARADDHGLIEFGCHSYGGLAVRDTHPAFELDGGHESSASTSEADEAMDDELAFFTATPNRTPRIGRTRDEGKRNCGIGKGADRFISEHNLALFWERRGLFPQTRGFPTPLVELSDFYAKGIRNRPPGNLRCDSARLRHFQRNLLAGEWCEDTGDCMRLWAVNDMSDHRKLLTLSFCVKEPSDDLLCLSKNFELPLAGLDLPTEALQLRAYNDSDVENKVFVRTKRSLLLADTSSNKMNYSTVFQTSVRSFMQIPHMSDEMVVVDGAGLVFWGACGNSFARVKSQLDVHQVCPTDCPRILLLMAEKELVQSDMRISNDNGICVYSLDKSSPTTVYGYLPGSSYEYTLSREVLCHVTPISVDKHSIILTTTRRHLLLDQRMLNKEVLSMAHSEINGADYCEVTLPFKDPISGGFVYSFFSLSQIIRPAVSHWAVMHHPSERIWSSLGPKYELQSPQDIVEFADYHIGTPLLSSVEDFPKYTRAIYYQQLPHKDRSILFRQMDDGGIWYENILFDPRSTQKDDLEKSSSKIRGKFLSLDNIMDVDTDHIEKELKDVVQKTTTFSYYDMKLQSLKAIRRYFRKRAKKKDVNSYVSGVDEHYVNSPSILTEAKDLRSIFPKVPVSDTVELPYIDPFGSVGEVVSVPSLELAEINVIDKVEDENRILSSIIVNIQKKTISLMESLKPAELPSSMDMDEDDDVNDIVEQANSSRLFNNFSVKDINDDFISEVP